jgi:hypothetical protein
MKLNRKAGKVIGIPVIKQVIANLTFKERQLRKIKRRFGIRDDFSIPENEQDIFSPPGVLELMIVWGYSHCKFITGVKRKGKLSL